MSMRVPTQEQWSDLAHRISPSRVFYGACETDSATPIKEVVCPQFTDDDLVAGTHMTVVMEHGQTLTEQIIMKVNDGEEKDFYAVQGTANSQGAWGDGETISMFFDGTGWALVGPNIGNINTVLESI